MKTEIFETKIHYPTVGKDITEECAEMYHRVKPGNNEIMIFNDTIIIMANKKDVHYLDMFQTELGNFKRKYNEHPELLADEELK
jgi:hypothetical protein